MRLSSDHRTLILRTIHFEIGADATVSLFGSRLNDAGRGGDIDLLIRCSEDVSPIQRARIKMQLESAMGIPVDIVVMKRNSPPTAFQRIAAARSVPV